MGKYFTETERYKLEAYLDARLPVIKIAALLGKTRQTIYNEIKRGTVVQKDTLLAEYTCYKADYAQMKYDNGKINKGRSLSIGNDMDFVRYVESKINKDKYSPFAILAEIKNKNLKFKTKICERTLYNYIQSGIFLNIPATRKQQHKKRTVSLNNIKGNSIENRPDISDRDEFGHWEMDTVVSGKNKGTSCLLVLTERMTRCELIFKMPDKKVASTSKCLNELEQHFGMPGFQRFFKTITCDNGVEFLSLPEFFDNCNLYYCHPYSSYERGSNEVANRFIRRFYPKGSDLGLVTQEDMSILVSYINNYPRKLFDGKSAYAYLKSVSPDFYDILLTSGIIA